MLSRPSAIHAARVARRPGATSLLPLRRKGLAVALTFALLATTGLAPRAWAVGPQSAPPPLGSASPAESAAPTPKLDRSEPLPKGLQGVGVKEQLDLPLPLDLTFTDEHGKKVRLGQYFTGKRPVLINLGYYGCPMLCGLVTKGLVEAVGKMDWTPGQQYEIVTLSIDPSERSALAMAKKRSVIEELGRPEIAAGWHFLTGEEKDIQRVADAVGFGFKWDASTSQYAHAAVLVLATPDGRVSRYLYGVKFPHRTLRLSLVEASEGKVGSVMDQLLLFCYHFDPAAGAYTMQAVVIMRAAGLMTLLTLASAIGLAFHREHRRSRMINPAATAPALSPAAPAQGPSLAPPDRTV